MEIAYWKWFQQLSKVYRNKVLWSIFCLLLLTAYAGNASSVSEKKMEEAAAALRYNDLRTAATIYQDVETSGFYSFDLFMNRATIYSIQDSVAKAILYTERALRIKPGNKAAQTYLRELQFSLPDHIPFNRNILAAVGLQSFASLLFPWGWALTGVVFFWMVMAMQLIQKWRKISLNKGLILSGLSIAFFLFFIAYLRQSQLTNQHYAIVLLGGGMMQGPDKESPEQLRLYPGNKVKLLEEIGAWQQVELGDGRKGWFPVEGLENIAWQ